MKQIPFTFQMPKEILEELRRESKDSGISVSSIIKSRISNYKKGGGAKEG